jgi:hypothetical protein
MEIEGTAGISDTFRPTLDVLFSPPDLNSFRSGPVGEVSNSKGSVALFVSSLRAECLLDSLIPLEDDSERLSEETKAEEEDGNGNDLDDDDEDGLDMDECVRCFFSCLFLERLDEEDGSKLLSLTSLVASC